MQPGAIVILIFIIVLLFVTIFCVRKSISDDREVQKEYQKNSRICTITEPISINAACLKMKHAAFFLT